MMSTILFHLGNLFNIFRNVTDAFTGSYSHDNKEIMRMRVQLETEDIPTFGTDRQNLRNDTQKVSRDYRKAFETKKEEYSF